MEIKNPGKKIKEICEIVGNGFFIKRIDLWNVIYKKIGSYEIEIGCVDNKKKKLDARIDVSKNEKIIFQIENICNIDSLKKDIIDIEEKIENTYWL